MNKQPPDEKNALVNSILWMSILNHDGNPEDARSWFEHQRMVYIPVVEYHEGRITMKDNSFIVALFDDILHATNCAQELTQTANRMDVKLCIHIDIREGVENKNFVEPAEFKDQLKGVSGIYISKTVFEAQQHHKESSLTLYDFTNKKKDELSMDELFLYKMKSIVDLNLKNEQFSVEDLANEMALSRSQVHRKLNSITGLSISQFIRNIRLVRARKMLEDEIGTSSEIGYRVGFSSPSYFSRCFHEYFGYAPGDTKRRKIKSQGESIEAFEIAFDDQKESNLFRLKEQWANPIRNRQLAAITIIERVESDEQEVSNYSNDTVGVLVQDEVRSHGGTVIQVDRKRHITYFNNTRDAVNSALAILKPEKQKITTLVKIGLHLGDMELSDSGLMEGEGFGVVQQLVELAVPGSIAISQKVKDEVNVSAQFDTKFLGTFNFKNAGRPIGVYALVARGIVVPNASSIYGKLKPSSFQGLHSLSMQENCRSIFSEMLIVKPALEKYLLMDEDDEDEDDVDIRILTYQIIKNFPWPIGIELRRLFSGSLRQNNQERLNQLLKTIHGIVQFVTLALVSELYGLLQRGERNFPPDFPRNFAIRLKRFHREDMIWIIAELLDGFQKMDGELTITEFRKLSSKQFTADLDVWAMDSLEVEMGRSWSLKSIESKSEFYEGMLTGLLKSLAFLVGFRLVNVNSIEVLKHKHTEPSFKHNLDILSSTDSEFRKKEEFADNFSESNSVLLKRTLKDSVNYLNLSPFIIDTHHQVLSISELNKIKKDIYVYVGFSGSEMKYFGSEVQEKSTLDRLENYELLLEEFKNLFLLLRENKTDLVT